MAVLTWKCLFLSANSLILQTPHRQALNMLRGWHSCPHCPCPHSFIAVRPMMASFTSCRGERAGPWNNSVHRGRKRPPTSPLAAQSSSLGDNDKSSYKSEILSPWAFFSLRHPLNDSAYIFTCMLSLWGSEEGTGVSAGSSPRTCARETWTLVPRVEGLPPRDGASALLCPTVSPAMAKPTQVTFYQSWLNNYLLIITMLIYEAVVNDNMGRRDVTSFFIACLMAARRSLVPMNQGL